VSELGFVVFKVVVCSSRLCGNGEKTREIGSFLQGVGDMMKGKYQGCGSVEAQDEEWYVDNVCMS